MFFFEIEGIEESTRNYVEDIDNTEIPDEYLNPHEIALEEARDNYTI